MNKIPFKYGSIAENPFYRFGQMMTLKKIAKEYLILLSHLDTYGY